MKVGDLVEYKRYKNGECAPFTSVHRAVVIALSTSQHLGLDTGLMKVLTTEGEFDYYIPKYCEIINESR